MSNQEINKQITEALYQTKGITTLDHSELTPKQVQAFRDIDCFAHEWLTHQATLIDQQADEIEKLKIDSQEWEDEYMSLKRRFEALDKSALESIKLLNESPLNFSLELAVKALEEMIANFEKVKDATEDIRLLPQQVLNGCHGISTQMILKYKSTLDQVRRGEE